MKLLTYKDIRNSKFTKEEQEFLLTKIVNPNTKYILFEQEEADEFFEIREWNLDDVNKRLSDLGYFAVKEVAKELFYKGLEYHNKIGLKTYECIDTVYGDIFDRLTLKDLQKFNKEKCFIRDKVFKKREIITVLIGENTLDIDIHIAAKDYYINNFNPSKSDYKYSYDDLDVKIF